MEELRIKGLDCILEAFFGQLGELERRLGSDSAYLEHIFKHAFLLHAIKSEIEHRLPIVIQIRKKEELPCLLCSDILDLDTKHIIAEQFFASDHLQFPIEIVEHLSKILNSKC